MNFIKIQINQWEIKQQRKELNPDSSLKLIKETCRGKMKKGHLHN